MERFRDFLRLRKRYDSIKFALILFICAAYFLSHGIVQIVNYAHYLNKPAEYILEAYSDSASLETAPDKICETDGVVSASFQRDYVISEGNGKTLTVSELSYEYLFECYGIDTSVNSRKIWLNSVAFDNFIGETDESHARLLCTVEGEKGNFEFIRCKALDCENEFAVSVGTTSSLESSRIVRVMFDGIDITGSDIRYIEKLGYIVVNREDMTLQSHNREMVFADIKYSIITTVLAAAGGFACFKIYGVESKTELQSRNISIKL